MKENLTVSWFSTGISSFMATYLMNDKIDKIIYNHIDDQHDDSLRFLHDCEEILQREIEIISSPYKNVDNVCRTFQFIKKGAYAPCTGILKQRVRKDWQLDHLDYNLKYVWGFDCSETMRSYNLCEAMPEFGHEFPLIDSHVTKEKAHTFCKRLGLKRPEMYNMGYRNNNCLGCVKGGMGYWNKIRNDFPEIFKSRCQLERDLNVSILTEPKLNTPLFLDELDPKRGRNEKEIKIECGIMCELNFGGF